MAYEQLLAILQEAREIDADEATKVPVECPNDGNLLVEAPGGVLHCTWDGWQYPRDA